jgi:hypothetical protein
LEGGDFVEDSVVAVHFDDGNEDLVASGSLFSASISYGFMVRLSSTLEDDSENYWVKKFHSRHTHFPEKMPSLELRWDDSTFVSGSSETFVIDPSGPYSVNMSNLKNQYESDETTQLRLHVRPFDYNPSVISSGSTVGTTYAMANAYYRITNDITDDIVVPFGTGSIKFTRLSYDVSGNFFDFEMRNLPAGNLYRLSFMFEVSGKKNIIDSGFKFKVI